MDPRELLVIFVSGSCLGFGAITLLREVRYRKSGQEGLAMRLRLPAIVAMCAALASMGSVVCESFLSALHQQPPSRPEDSVFLSLATVLVLFMLFGFVAFEAGTVSVAYRNQSAEKNLLVVIFALAAYLSVGRYVHALISQGPQMQPAVLVFQAGFACTVALIIANAITERASTTTNILCALIAAGIGYPIAAALIWGESGALLRRIGFIDASAAGAVHLLAASASMVAAAMVGPRVRLERLRLLGWPEAPDFRSPWSVVGGLFLMFGWLGFNSGNAHSDLHGHAFQNTMVGACGGALGGYLLSRIPVVLWREGNNVRRAATARLLEALAAKPRIVIGMMGGLVAVTANGALIDVTWAMAGTEALVGGTVAVAVSTWMSLRPKPFWIDDPLGVIGTHGCAALVGLLSTPLWLDPPDGRFFGHLLAQLIGCGVCIAIGIVVAAGPCLLLRGAESLALAKGTRAHVSGKFSLRLGAMEQLGTPREVPLSPEWNDVVEEAKQRILQRDEEASTGPARGDVKFWEAVEIYAANADLIDRSTQARAAHVIAEKLPDTIGWPRAERAALVALGGSAEYAKPEDIGIAISYCLGQANDRVLAKRAVLGGGTEQEVLVWCIAMLTERAAVLARSIRPEMAQQARAGESFLSGIGSRSASYLIRDLARTGRIAAGMRLRKNPRSSLFKKGVFCAGSNWQVAYALVQDVNAIAVLLFLSEHPETPVETLAGDVELTIEECLRTVGLLASHGLVISSGASVAIKERGLWLVQRLVPGRRGVATA